VDFLQVTLRALREQDLALFHSLGFRPRSRSTTSVTGLTRPCSISLVPNARIFSSARVSWVS
jgi:hypothetical protein